MIDIHSHIIFDVDDGPMSLDQSLDLIRAAYDQGVRQIVATSHRRRGMFETPEAKIWANFQTVREEAKAIASDLELYYGGELYFTPDIVEKLDRKELPTMHGTRFALIEFSSQTPYKDIHNAVNKLSLLGLTPVIAHIERYNALEFDEKKVKELINMGAYMQVNAGHVLKAKFFGDPYKVYKKRAKFFMDKDLVHCIASDMHNTDSRKPQMKEAYEAVVANYGQAKAQELFVTNPQTLLENNYI